MRRRQNSGSFPPGMSDSTPGPVTSQDLLKQEQIKYDENQVKNWLLSKVVCSEVCYELNKNLI